MNTIGKSICTQHEDMIHDVQMDFYGRRVASCSSDKVIKIFDVNPQTKEFTFSADLRGHSAPVWQVCWAHPKFGTILASCGYDGRIIVWKEEGVGQWSRVFEYSKHTSSVNSISFAPHDFGLVLACASTDKYISVHTFDTKYNEREEINDEKFSGWDSFVIESNDITSGLCTLSWQQSYFGTGDLNLVAGGCDNKIRIWPFHSDSNSGKTKCDEKNVIVLDGHKDWVRDVACSPDLTGKLTKFASGGQDCKVFVWTKDLTTDKWLKTEVGPGQFSDVIWRVSWSPGGNLLAVTSGDRVTLWKEPLGEQWQLVQEVTRTM